jgi:hypothetical protein
MSFNSLFTYTVDALFNVTIDLLCCPAQLAEGCGGVGKTGFVATNKMHLENFKTLTNHGNKN